MSPVVSKKSKAIQPAVALLSQAAWVNQQLEQASWRHVGKVAREIVGTLSEEEMRNLHPYDDYLLARSLVDAPAPEADLFTGIS